MKRLLITGAASIAALTLAGCSADRLIALVDGESAEQARVRRSERAWRTWYLQPTERVIAIPETNDSPPKSRWLDPDT